MKTINLNETWGRITTEAHRTKPSRHNLAKRELLLGLQILLGQYHLAKNENNKELMKFCVDILETYEKYDINGYIIWER